MKPTEAVTEIRARPKSTCPSDVVKLVCLSENQEERQVCRYVYRSALKRELNMSLDITKFTSFWKHVQHLGSTFTLQRYKRAITRPIKMIPRRS